MKCKHCIEKEKTWDENNSPIECAFETGVFSPNNWNCWTMDYLRERSEKNEVWNDDEFAWLVPYDIEFDKEDTIDEWCPSTSWYIYIQQYKHRGTTDICLDMNTLEPLELDLAYLIIDKYGN